jgi:predicted XRE-type DNA-binding protein
MKEIEDISQKKSSGNIFADLGLPEPDERMAKADLAMRITQSINERHLTQRQTANLLGIHQSEVATMLNGQLKEFFLEKLNQFVESLKKR